MGALRLEDISYTYEDYKNWDGKWELYDGMPMAMAPAPVRKHQGLASELIYILRKQLDECVECEVLGEVDYKLNDNTILRPDIVLTCNENTQEYLVKAPEIVIEIVSPTTAKRDEIYKFEMYKSEKVRYYVLVYPDDLYAKIYKLDGKDYDKQGDFFKEKYHFEDTQCGIEIDFEQVFKRFRK